ncbi:replication protein A 70 kDa DNA-binding subunit B [Tanacetum coccineum]
METEQGGQEYEHDDDDGDQKQQHVPCNNVVNFYFTNSHRNGTRKVSKAGKRFGFARFFRVGNVLALGKRLNRIRIGSFKLRANIAKFEKSISKSKIGCEKDPWVFEIPSMSNKSPTFSSSPSIVCKVKFLGGSKFSLEFNNSCNNEEERSGFAIFGSEESVEVGARKPKQFMYLVFPPATKDLKRIVALVRALDPNLSMQTMEQKMTLLFDIDPMMDDVKVLARCISIWKSHAAGKPNQPWGLDVGNRIQASIKLENMNKFLAILDEGSCYRIGDFGVGENGGKFPLLNHRHKLNFYRNTTVTRVIPFDQNPRGFNFEPFQDDLVAQILLEYDAIVYAKVHKIHRENRWTYIGCKICGSKAKLIDSTIVTGIAKPLAIFDLLGIIHPSHQRRSNNSGGAKNMKLLKLYKVIVHVIDQTGSGSLLLFDDMISQLVGVPCYKLKEQYGANAENTFPEELTNNIVGKRLLLRATYSEYNISNNNHVYQVKMMSEILSLLSILKKILSLRMMMKCLNPPAPTVGTRHSRLQYQDSLPFNLEVTPPSAKGKEVESSDKGKEVASSASGNEDHQPDKSAVFIETNRNGKRTVIDLDEYDDEAESAK